MVASSFTVPWLAQMPSKVVPACFSITLLFFFGAVLLHAIDHFVFASHSTPVIDPPHPVVRTLLQGKQKPLFTIQDTAQ
jgi:hypothetical protein